MPKRKRDNGALLKSDDEEDRTLKIRKSRFVAKKEQGNVLLHRALKIARGFERQKLGRRRKTAKEKPHELLRLKEELIALKQLDLVQAAENYLFKQLVRTKRIRESASFISLYGDDAAGKVKGATAGAEANVVGRLMNSNPVREVMPGIMSGMYSCLGLEDLSVEPATRVKVSQAAREAEGKRGNRDGNLETMNGTGDLADLHTGESDGDADDDSFATFDDQLASASDEEDSIVKKSGMEFEDRIPSLSDSENVSDSEGAAESREAKPSPTHLLNKSIVSQRAGSLSISLSPSPTPPRSTSPPPRSLTKSNPSFTPTFAKHPANTTFLPSLTLGGYFSGSEFDFDDDPSSRHRASSSLGPALPQPRKNRRGQRARQQIAEKKFGSKAKHLLKRQADGKEGRDAGWDVKKGATDASKTRRNVWQDKKGGRGLRATGANGEAVNIKSRDKSKGDNNGPLHPSWEAAKKRKEKGQKVTGMFQGKKISFD
jgi:BUD22